MFSWKNIAIGLLIIATGILGAFFFVSCKTFEPIWIKDLPPECNMSLNVIKTYHASEEKSGTVIPVSECFSALKELSCRAEAFGLDKEGRPNLVDQFNRDKYTHFLNCKARK